MKVYLFSRDYCAGYDCTETINICIFGYFPSFEQINNVLAANNYGKIDMQKYKHFESSNNFDLDYYSFELNEFKVIM